MISLSRNDYEPDICFWGKEKAQEFHKDLMIHPAPDLIVEVLSKSTADRDRGVKFNDYEAHGITEYWIIDPEEESVDVYRLPSENNSYGPALSLRKMDHLTSSILPGFAVPILAIFDKKTNLATLKKMLTGQ